MQFLKRNFNIILVCLLEVLVGILLLVNPVAFTSGIIIAVGVMLLIAGIAAVIEYFRTDPVEASFRGGFAKGAALILTGGFFVLKPSWLISTFPVLTIIYGVAILIGGLNKAQWFVDALRMKTGRWIFHAVNAAVSIICAVIILASPFESTVVLWMFIGITLIVSAVLDVAAMFCSRKKSEDVL